MKTVVLIRERRSENKRYEDTFSVPYCMEDVEGMLRYVVGEYLKTPEGRQTIRSTGGDFNWGDVINEIPEEFLEAYEIRYDATSEVITVDQDEVLFPDYQQQVLEEDEEDEI